MDIVTADPRCAVPECQKRSKAALKSYAGRVYMSICIVERQYRGVDMKMSKNISLSGKERLNENKKGKGDQPGARPVMDCRFLSTKSSVEEAAGRNKQESIPDILFPSVSSQSSARHICKISRRSLLGLIGSAAAGCALLGGARGAVAGSFSKSVLNSGKRYLSLRHIHTGETFSGVYKIGDEYIYDAFEKINILMRDFRTGDVYPVDPRLIDILWQINQKSGSKYPFQVLSGYRSPKTNLKLAKSTDGVATNSYHMSGQAVDIRLPYYKTAGLRELAVSLRSGGVGYYPRSDFVHVDTGKFRTW